MWLTLSNLTDDHLQKILKNSDFYLSDDEDVTEENGESEYNLVLNKFGENKTVIISDDSDFDLDDDVPLNILKSQWQKENSESHNTEKLQTWNNKVFKNNAIETTETTWEAASDHEFWTHLKYFNEYYDEDFWEYS